MHEILSFEDHLEAFRKLVQPRLHAKVEFSVVVSSAVSE